MARRVARARFIRPPPRTKMWIGQGIGDLTLTGSATVLMASLSAGALLLRPFTILRTRKLITFASDQIAASEAPTGSFGDIVVTSAAAAIGVTAVPNPSGVTGDPEADWFVWQALQFDWRRATDVGLNGPSSHQYEVDSKAMRKVGPDDDVVTIVDMETGAGAFMSTNGRQLIQLH